MKTRALQQSRDSGQPVAGVRSSTGDRREASAAILQLQRSVGNRAAAQWLSGAIVQRACDCGGTCEHCQAQASNSPTFSEFLSGKGSGAPLQRSTRDFMESRFGEDFSGVRVHTDAHAARSAEQINAVAYTSGSDIFFAQGQYRPDTDAGRHLLAHELTHTIQQGGGPVSMQTSLRVNEPNDVYEQEADRVASAVMAQRDDATSPAITPLATSALQSKQCATGRFKDTNELNAAATGRQYLTPTFDLATGEYGKEFQVRAEFQSLINPPNCYYGQYRQFVKAWGSINDKPVVLGLEGSKANADTFVEDSFVMNGTTYRPGHRLDQLKLDQYSIYHDDKGKNIAGCKYWMKDRPALKEPVKAGDTLKFHAEFLGQLIDTCRHDESQTTPHDFYSLLDYMYWIVDGTYQVPDGWKPTKSKSAASGAPGKPSGSSDVKDKVVAKP